MTDRIVSFARIVGTGFLTEFNWMSSSQNCNCLDRLERADVRSGIEYIDCFGAIFLFLFHFHKPEPILSARNTVYLRFVDRKHKQFAFAFRYEWHRCNSCDLYALKETNKRKGCLGLSGGVIIDAMWSCQILSNNLNTRTHMELCSWPCRFWPLSLFNESMCYPMLEIFWMRMHFGCC